ncbi:MAG: hypothetical protein GY729_12280 [Desulfobacteraceae bacterium]|nr:hypothetical protein [Desulfobacteraceae bacterium]
MRIKKQIVSYLFIPVLLIGVCAYGFDAGPPQAKNITFKEDTSTVQSLFQASAADTTYPWRGILMGGDHTGSTTIHHDNIYVQINGGPIMYQTTIPVRKDGNQLPDEGLLWHLYTRDNTDFTVYATSAYYWGAQSDLSLPFTLPIAYSDPSTCTEQTVPVSVAGDDQIVNTGTLVTLDGSLSYDEYGPDNSDLFYRWECYSAPESAVVLSDEGEAAVTTFTPNQTGNYYFRFQVRDKLDDGTIFNRSPVSYLKISVVQDMSSVSYINANAGRTQQAQVGQVVTLDGSQSQGSDGITSYTWTMQNPMNTADIDSISSRLGFEDCQGDCYPSNYDADSDVDGSDLALLAGNYSRVELPDQAVVQFVPGIAKPYIFTLRVEDGTLIDSETTIVAANHPNVSPVLTHPDVDSICFE